VALTGGIALGGIAGEGIGGVALSGGIALHAIAGEDIGSCTASIRRFDRKEVYRALKELGWELGCARARRGRE
jgi:hypothetical protein